MKAIFAAATICFSAVAASGVATTATAQASGLLAVGANAEIEPPQGWQVTRDRSLVRFTPPEGDFTVTITPVAGAKDAAVQAWRLANPAFA